MVVETNLQFNFNRIKELGAKLEAKNSQTAPAYLKEPGQSNTDRCSRSLDVDRLYSFYL